MANLNYNEKVDKRLRERSPEVFGNFTRENAQYIIPTFIQGAKKSVEILSGSIPDGFYSDAPIEGCVSIFDALRTAADGIVANNPNYATPSIRILTLDGVKHEGVETVAKEINEKHRGIIEVIQAKYIGNQKMKHFLVVDGERYRLEEFHEPFAEPPTVLKAEVCCNGPEKAGKMESLFNSLWSSVA